MAGASARARPTVPIPSRSAHPNRPMCGLPMCATIIQTGGRYKQKGPIPQDRPFLYPVWMFGSALTDRHVIALRRAGIELTRAADLLRRIGDHLVPLRHPAHRAGEGKENREHVGRETDRRQDYARIEVDIGIELLLDEIGIVKRDLLQIP